MEEKQTKKAKFSYQYIIIAICAMMIFVGLGFCSSTKGLYLNPVLEHTGISRGLYGFSDTFRFVTTAVVNIFFGTLIAKFGAKKLVGAGFLSLITSMILYATSSHVIGFYFAGMFLGLGLAWTTTTMIGYIVRRWVKNNRGTVMGFILATNGLGGALATNILNPIIQQGGTSYQRAYFITAIILLCIGILAVIFIKDNKEYKETAPEVKKPKGDNWIGIESKVAFKKKYFYGAVACIFITGFVLQSITGVFIAHIQIVGLDQTTQDIIITAKLLILTVTKLLTGFMYDKLGLRKTITINFVASIIAMLSIGFVDASSMGIALCVIYIICANIALPLETIMLPIYAGDLFGEKDYSKMLGIMVSVNTAGYALGSPIMGFVFDICGSYVPAFFVGAGLMAITLITMQFVISAANKEKIRIQKEFDNQNNLEAQEEI